MQVIFHDSRTKRTRRIAISLPSLNWNAKRILDFGWVVFSRDGKGFTWIVLWCEISHPFPPSGVEKEALVPTGGRMTVRDWDCMIEMCLACGLVIPAGLTILTVLSWWELGSARGLGGLFGTFSNLLSGRGCGLVGFRVGYALWWGMRGWVVGGIGFRFRFGYAEKIWVDGWLLELGRDKYVSDRLVPW